MELVLAAWAALLVYIATNVDDLVVVATQLALAEPPRHRGILRGQRAAFYGVVATSLLLGNALRVIPTAAFGLLAVVPLISGLRGLWHLRSAELRDQGPVVAPATGFVTSFLVTIALSGDNLAVYIPLLRAASAGVTAVTLVVFVLANIAMLSACRWLAMHPAVVGRVRRASPYLLPFVLIGLAAYVAVDTGLI